MQATAEQTAISALRAAAEFAEPLAMRQYLELTGQAVITGPGIRDLYSMFGTFEAACQAAGIAFCPLPRAAAERMQPAAAGTVIDLRAQRPASAPAASPRPAAPADSAGLQPAGTPAHPEHPSGPVEEQDSPAAPPLAAAGSPDLSPARKATPAAVRPPAISDEVIWREQACEAACWRECVDQIETIVKTSTDIEPMGSRPGWSTYYGPDGTPVTVRLINGQRKIEAFSLASESASRRYVGGAPAGPAGVRKAASGRGGTRWPGTFKELTARCSSAGLAVEHRNGGHLSITNPAGGCTGSVTLPSTSSNPRALKNAVLEIRRVLGTDVREAS